MFLMSFLIVRHSRQILSSSIVFQLILWRRYMLRYVRNLILRKFQRGLGLSNFCLFIILVDVPFDSTLASNINRRKIY